MVLTEQCIRNSGIDFVLTRLEIKFITVTIIIIVVIDIIIIIIETFLAITRFIARGKDSHIETQHKLYKGKILCRFSL